MNLKPLSLKWVPQKPAWDTDDWADGWKQQRSSCASHYTDATYFPQERRKITEKWLKSSRIINSLLKSLRHFVTYNDKRIIASKKAKGKRYNKCCVLCMGFIMSQKNIFGMKKRESFFSLCNGQEIRKRDFLPCCCSKVSNNVMVWWSAVMVTTLRLIISIQYNSILKWFIPLIQQYIYKIQSL